MSASSSGNIVAFPTSKKKKAAPIVSFDRRELDMLLQLYSRHVGTGEWRDYAMDMLNDRAVFSVFKRTSEVPLYTIEKTPKLARRQGQWSVVNAAGLILKRGHDLKTVLRIFDKKPKLVSF